MRTAPLHEEDDDWLEPDPEEPLYPPDHLVGLTASALTRELDRQCSLMNGATDGTQCADAEARIRMVEAEIERRS